MFLFDAAEILEHTSGIIHENTQRHKKSLDLTVSDIYRFTSAGSLDFGGSEFEAAATEMIKATKQSEDDDYGWWKLEEGIYKAVFNENLHSLEDTLVAISPHDHARKAGIIANTQLLAPNPKLEPVELVFKVGPEGCNIKENARFATMHLMAE